MGAQIFYRDGALSGFKGSSFQYSNQVNIDNVSLSNLYESLEILKENIDTLDATLQQNKTVNRSVEFAANNFLQLNLASKEDYEIFKESIGKVNSALKDIGRNNIVISERNQKHPEYEMYVQKNDSTHKIYVVQDYLSYHSIFDAALFHEVTHYIDTLGTTDNYDYTTFIPSYVTKEERLSNSQSWTLFYRSAFGR